ncbi:hypothetical protein HDA32_004534 [Spinactinospora alkalitolerans]|uniref:DUF397 domain-containing protein n=1 Tax=Spinactinospora alkalitolerans TaxID=687207 RepID=A0A852U5Q6_9ACTN|nr:DUF397 domain-containing protein [Spinactinospora alkalitolerans]NYE49414.1 hypothetical protein [Spinactinospora alkalitolerans]
MSPHAPWRKSSYSAGNANCVECASVAWTKSSHSHGNADCVECAPLPTFIALRDSQNPSHGHLSLPAAEWSAFLTAVKEQRL